MASKTHSWIKRSFLIAATLFAISMVINWLMTYNLESSLRKRLRTEIINATDSLYDFSFKTLDMAIEAIEHNPDNILTTPTALKRSGKLWEIALSQKPEFYKTIPLDQQSDSIRIFIARETARKNNTSLNASLTK